MQNTSPMRKRTLRVSVLSTFMALALLVTSAFQASAQPTATWTEQVQSLFTTAGLMDASISDLQQQLEAGSVTSAQLVQMYLDRIEAYDQSLGLNSIISLNGQALEQAAKLDAERAAGNVRGPLHGIPVLVKDNYDVEGLATSAGATALKDSIAPDDAYVVAKLKEAGAIILAKANLSEFAMSGANSRSSLGGTVHNAYDNTRTAAGSSGGTAVSVTSNFAAAGLGTDTGSSIRRPSSFSNLYGLRPSTGLTSRDGVVPLNMDRDVTGPMCRTVEDLALLLDTMAGTDPTDAWTADADRYIPEEGYAAHLKADGLKGKRIGYLMNSFGYHYTVQEEEIKPAEIPVDPDPKISGIVETAVSTLKEGGAELVDMSTMLPENLYTQLRNAGYADVFEWDLNTYLATLGPNAPMKSMWDIKENGGHMTGSIASAHNPLVDPITDPRESAEYQAMKEKMLAFRETVNQILAENHIDAVVFLSQNDVADKEETSDNKNNAASYLNNFGPVAGLPEMMLPMGFAQTDPEHGFDTAMPLGLSLFSSYGNEATLIEIAYGYEQTATDIRKAPERLPALADTRLNTLLASFLTEASALAPEDYTSSTWEDLATALSAAKAVDTSDVAATSAAALALAQAYDALEASPVSSGSSSTDSSSETPSSSEVSAVSSHAGTSSMTASSMVPVSSGSPAASSEKGSTPGTGESNTPVVLLFGLLAGAGAVAVLLCRRTEERK